MIDSFLTAYIQEQENKNESKEIDQEERYFQPKYPTPLSQEEKNIDIKKRIAKKYIGKLPSQIEDMLFYFSHFEECLKNNITIYNRILLHGKPGTGKSHLVKVIAEELGLPLLSFSASFFGDKYIGESARRIRKAFESAKAFNKPLIIFIDEIDALASKRKNDMHTEHRAALVTLLTELQDLQNNKNIFVFVATNNLEALDPAIKDRFAGSICEIKEHTIEERAQLFEKLFFEKKVSIDPKLAYRLAVVTKPYVSNNGKNQFSNRDVEYIVTTALLKSFADSFCNPQQSKHLCFYLRKAIDATNKNGRFALLSPTYCHGI